MNSPRGSQWEPVFTQPLTEKYALLTRSHPLDLDDVFRGEGAPVVLVPRKQLVDARPLLVHEGVDAVLDLPAVLVQLGLMG